MTIMPPALVSSPQPRPAPTSRALPSNNAAQRGQNWTPMRGQICAPIDNQAMAGSIFDANLQQSPLVRDPLAARLGTYVGYNWQFAPNWLIGVEGDVAFAWQDGNKESVAGGVRGGGLLRGSAA